MKNYELLYILPASKTSDEIVKDFQDVQKHIEKFGGTMLETLLEHPFLAKAGTGKEEEPEEIKSLPITKRKLAYPIKHEKFGFYCLVNFQTEAKKIEDIDEYLRLNNNVLRHIIIQADPMTKDQLELLQTLFARKKAEQDKEEAEQRETAAAKEDARKASRRGNIENKPAEETEKIESEEEPVEQESQEEVVVEAKKEEEEKDESKKTKEKPDKKELKENKAADEKEETSKEEKKSGHKSKIKLEDLEDKLDEILESTIV